MKEKIFMGLTVICLVVWCYFGIRDDSQIASETQSHNHAKVVHETVTVYY